VPKKRFQFNKKSNQAVSKILREKVLKKPLFYAIIGAVYIETE